MWVTQTQVKKNPSLCNDVVVSFLSWSIQHPRNEQGWGHSILLIHLHLMCRSWCEPLQVRCNKWRGSVYTKPTTMALLASPILMIKMVRTRKIYSGTNFRTESTQAVCAVQTMSHLASRVICPDTYTEENVMVATDNAVKLAKI